MSVTHGSHQPDLGQADTDHRTLIELRSTADRLAAEVEQLTVAWDAADDVDTSLGVEVEESGRAVMSLLDAVAGMTRSIDPLRTRQLQDYAIDLHEALDYYAELDEHETDASIDIFDRLMPGIALAQRVVNVLEDPAAAQGVTVGELIERLRPFPHHLQVWSTDPAHPQGYTPLYGTAIPGTDPDPGPGEPSPFIVLGRHEFPTTVNGFGAQRTAPSADDPHPLATDGHLRGTMVDGYDPDRVNSVLGHISDLAELRLVSVWDYYDAYGFGGNSQFYVEEEGGVLRELTGDLWRWLNGDPSESSTPASPGSPATWIGPLADITADQLPHDDGSHNYSRQLR